MKKFWTISVLIYLTLTVLFTVSVLKIIPFIIQNGIEQPSAYFLTAGSVLFILFILTVVIFLFSNSQKNINSYLLFYRIKSLDKNDIISILIGIAIIIIANGLLFGFERLLIRFGFNELFYGMPDFTGFSSIQKGDFNILYAYIPYLIFNIFGEEILWRGYLLHLQEKYYPKIAWIINSAFWLLFHIVFKQYVIQMLPLIIVLPYLVFKRKNTSVGIAIHAIMGLIGFLSIVADLL